MSVWTFSQLRKHQKRKEVKIMNYVKPEVTMLAKAVVAIQNPFSKAKAQTTDANINDPEMASLNAYAADE
jgi:hypothetical protein